MNRFFVWAPNYNPQMEISYIPNPSRDNLSLRLRSRHNESYTHENRFGGYGFGLHLDSVKPGREEYHNEHTSLPDFNLHVNWNTIICILLDTQFIILQMVNR
jgi:hypothetical protein